MELAMELVSLCMQMETYILVNIEDLYAKDKGK